MPPDYVRQLQTLLRAEWPGDEPNDDTARLIDPADAPTFFVLVKEGKILSYARTILSVVNVHGQALRIAGLGDVLTPPGLRGRGLGTRVVERATRFLEAEASCDLAVLLTTPALERFYGCQGWKHLPSLRVVTDETDDEPTPPPFAMVLLLSETGQQAIESIIADGTLCLPGAEW